MASNGNGTQTFAPPEAWTSTYAILQSADATPEAKLFAATTLKGKITYDLHQLPREQLQPLRDSLLSILAAAATGPKPIRTQLCVCLANLAIQMTEWKDVLQLVVSSLDSNAQSVACMLEFLHVLPEEVTEGRKIALSEEELEERTVELLQLNADQVLKLLIQYSQSSVAAAKSPQLLNCITSWLREIPMNDIVNSPLLDTIISALSSDEAFESAVECLSAIYRETREVDESAPTIQALFPKIIALRPRIAQAEAEEDTEVLKGLTRIFAEAGEAWVVLLARMPDNFRPLVEAILECCSRDHEKDAIGVSFVFWYELKQYLTLDNYGEARAKYADLFSKLVDIMIHHLQFPKAEGGNEEDLFQGDREQEEKFREFRHQMGDVLKDCCEVIGVVECLKKTHDLIQEWVKTNGAQASQNGTVPNWQAVEAPIFSMRAMGRMVGPEEGSMVGNLIQLIVQIPDHDKVRFQTVMALGRYTEWTAQHPESLEIQLQFIMAAFEHRDIEVVRAAALSFSYFCKDCADLMKGYINQLQNIYVTLLDRLGTSSQAEVTEGIAAIINKQPLGQIYSAFKMYCDPVIDRLKTQAQTASTDPEKLAIADRLDLICIFVDNIVPYVEPGNENPAVKYCQEIFPILATIQEAFMKNTPIIERVCRCWRRMIFSYRTAMAPVLPMLANKLAAGFSATRQGGFLWATDAIVREFSEDGEHVDPATSQAIFQFCEQQTDTFLHALSDLTPEELPDATSASLTLLKEEPLTATLRFLRDYLAYGSEELPTSSFGGGSLQSNPKEVQNAVKQTLLAQGETVTQRVMTGMMYSFPRDCQPDASGVLLALFQVLPQETAQWLQATIGMLPAGSMTEQESQRFLSNINQYACLLSFSHLEM
ncbi:hypothetical protein FH972_026656 [Carpinus fangiana]|uniref:Importin N-terminal domain-containing protein n=1 Tax=Carpinus fangiana TaxID=176857 RepID=A0A5N6L4X4_9ROSI|nr:hypothetical protein FH972_026656 [Carpinus fangiana]